MKIRIIIKTNDGKILEEYVVPSHSWIQTETLGAQYVPATLEPKIINLKGEIICLVEPINPPKIRTELLEMVEGDDRAWGKNGFRYLAKNREKYGGSPLDRLKELAEWNLIYGKQGPVPFLPGEAEQLSKL